jgi:hypothetical protein
MESTETAAPRPAGGDSREVMIPVTWDRYQGLWDRVVDQPPCQAFKPVLQVAQLTRRLGVENVLRMEITVSLIQGPASAGRSATQPPPRGVEAKLTLPRTIALSRHTIFEV